MNGNKLVNKPAVPERSTERCLRFKTSKLEEPSLQYKLEPIDVRKFGNDVFVSLSVPTPASPYIY